MTFQELLNSRSHDYDCSIIIGDVEMNAASATARIAFTVKLSRRLLKCDGGLELCPLFDE